MEQSEINHFWAENTEENRMLLQKKDICDKYDYLVAVACGGLGGIIDIFMVGSPGDSALGKWTDEQVDNAVKKFAKMVGWNPKKEKTGNIADAIKFLEDKYKVNYDQRHTGDVDNIFSMSIIYHHIMSLAHSPDIVGLFFSLLNQFTSTSSFVVNGQIITIKTDTYELQGGNFIAKLFCGVANWFGHIMSDIAGTADVRKNAGRGIGLVMPFYELFQFCKFGEFNVGKDKQDLATIAMQAFQKGYDFRFALAASIPVMITDLSIRLIWALRRHFQYGYPLKECIPTHKHADLRIMLLFGNGTLCVIDGIDAGARSGGNFLTFFMRLNMVAWFRLVCLVLKEVCIRLGIEDSLQINIDAYKRINQALLSYLNELEKIDIKLFERETEEYNKMIKGISSAKTQRELHEILNGIYDRMGYNKPWQGDFDEHMSNKNAMLVFE